MSSARFFTVKTVLVGLAEVGPVTGALYKSIERERNEIKELRKKHPGKELRYKLIHVPWLGQSMRPYMEDSSAR